MTTTLKVDKAGRVVLPKPVREELQLGPGDQLEVESSEDHIVLRPVRGSVPIRKKQGVWVYRTGVPLSASVVTEVLRGIRQDRDRHHVAKRR